MCVKGHFSVAQTSREHVSSFASIIGIRLFIEKEGAAVDGNNEVEAAGRWVQLFSMPEVVTAKISIVQYVQQR
ncbi:hypothetical protein KIN20_019958 [Parelaphostrongylus tenuis]|uniref:Uncharacterized protein n=1 Tax=Parelaphostrongylus tenuis TaxID=148309 RepID=A0AAD5QT78_PARTN|nr:hypothetical protein KIN20_019958 [Parelaphostrongylus tenuis]